MELAGRVVLVTGASSGIGEATARLAHERGALVVLAARRADRLRALETELPGSLAVRTDVTRPAEVHELVDRALEAHGRLDVLVNNAGQGLHVPLEEVEVEAFRAILELNVVAPLVAMQAVVPVMRRQGGGVIVNISSGTSRVVMTGVGAYAATEAALNMLSQVARAELAGDGIAVCVVYPFITDTEFHDVLAQGTMSARGRRFQPDAPEVVAKAVLRAVETGEEEVVLTPTQRGG